MTRTADMEEGNVKKSEKKLSTSFMDYCLIRSLSCTLFSKQFCKFRNKISPTSKYAQIYNCRYLSNEIGTYKGVCVKCIVGKVRAK